MAVPVVPIFDIGDYAAEILRAADLLKAGKIIVLPTETVYGAAGLLGDADALSSLRSIRGGPTDKPFTVHLAHRDDVKNYIDEPNDYARHLTRKLWPGPVGLMFDVPEQRCRDVAERFRVAQSDLYENGAITLRCPDHIVATDVIGRVAGPIVLTVAGSAGAGASPQQISSGLDGKVELILDAGPTRYNRPSTLLRVKADGYDIVRSGVYDERIIERLLRTTILFVCSGNTCRSPMAEALARSMLAKKLGVSEDDLEKKGIIITSAGSFAVPGTRATPQAVEALKGLGADLSRHRSRPLTVELIHQADAIFTMSRAHAGAVLALVPAASDKTVTLDPAGDIEDPIGGDLSLYQQLAAQMRAMIEKRLEERMKAEG